MELYGISIEDDDGEIDYFLSGFEGCCLNCPEEERTIICGSGIWCDRCLCLKDCKYYRKNLNRKGYCAIRIELLSDLKEQYLRNPDKVGDWLRKLRSEGVRTPSYAWQGLRETLLRKLEGF